MAAHLGEPLVGVDEPVGLLGADRDANGELDVETVLRSVFSHPSGKGAGQFSRVFAQLPNSLGGGTNFGLNGGVDYSCWALEFTTQPNRTMVFMSDGEATTGGSVSAILPCSHPVRIETVAVGPGSSCTNRGTGNYSLPVGSLAEIAAYGGGTCTQITDPDDLAGVLTQAVVPRITSVTLSADGGPPVDVSVSVTPELPHSGAGELQLATVAPEAEELCLTVTAVTGSGDPFTVTECVGATAQTPPVAEAGPDQIVVEGTRVTLDGSGSSDAEGDPLTYTWELLTLDGPPLLIAGGAGPLGTTQTLDDGSYTFQLTVSDGLHTATDTVAVTVTNAAPVAVAQADGAAAGGVALLTAQVTDDGVIDTHEATVDWGDGTPTGCRWRPRSSTTRSSAEFWSARRPAR